MISQIIRSICIVALLTPNLPPSTGNWVAFTSSARANALPKGDTILDIVEELYLVFDVFYEDRPDEFDPQKIRSLFAETTPFVNYFLNVDSILKKIEGRKQNTFSGKDELNLQNVSDEMLQNEKIAERMRQLKDYIESDAQNIAFDAITSNPGMMYSEDRFYDPEVIHAENLEEQGLKTFAEIVKIATYIMLFHSFRKRYARLLFRAHHNKNKTSVEVGQSRKLYNHIQSLSPGIPAEKASYVNEILFGAQYGFLQTDVVSRHRISEDNEGKARFTGIVEYPILAYDLLNLEEQSLIPVKTIDDYKKIFLARLNSGMLINHSQVNALSLKPIPLPKLHQCKSPLIMTAPVNGSLEKNPVYEENIAMDKAMFMLPKIKKELKDVFSEAFLFQTPEGQPSGYLKQLLVTYESFLGYRLNIFKFSSVENPDTEEEERQQRFNYLFKEIAPLVIKEEYDYLNRASSDRESSIIDEMIDSSISELDLLHPLPVAEYLAENIYRSLNERIYSLLYQNILFSDFDFSNVKKNYLLRGPLAAQGGIGLHYDLLAALQEQKELNKSAFISNMKQKIIPIVSKIKLKRTRTNEAIISERRKAFVDDVYSVVDNPALLRAQKVLDAIEKHRVGELGHQQYYPINDENAEGASDLLIKERWELSEHKMSELSKLLDNTTALKIRTPAEFAAISDALFEKHPRFRRIGKNRSVLVNPAFSFFYRTIIYETQRRFENLKVKSPQSDDADLYKTALVRGLRYYAEQYELLELHRTKIDEISTKKFSLDPKELEQSQLHAQDGHRVSPTYNEMDAEREATYWSAFSKTMESVFEFFLDETSDREELKSAEVKAGLRYNSFLPNDNFIKPVAEQEPISIDKFVNYLKEYKGPKLKALSLDSPAALEEALQTQVKALTPSNRALVFNALSSFPTSSPAYAGILQDARNSSFKEIGKNYQEHKKRAQEVYLDTKQFQYSSLQEGIYDYIQAFGLTSEVLYPSVPTPLLPKKKETKENWKNLDLGKSEESSYEQDDLFIQYLIAKARTDQARKREPFLKISTGHEVYKHYYHDEFGVSGPAKRWNKYNLYRDVLTLVSRASSEKERKAIIQAHIDPEVNRINQRIEDICSLDYSGLEDDERFETIFDEAQTVLYGMNKQAGMLSLGEMDPKKFSEFQQTLKEEIRPFQTFMEDTAYEISQFASMGAGGLDVLFLFIVPFLGPAGMTSRTAYIVSRAVVGGIFMLATPALAYHGGLEFGRFFLGGHAAAYRRRLEIIKTQVSLPGLDAQRNFNELIGLAGQERNVGKLFGIAFEMAFAPMISIGIGSHFWSKMRSSKLLRLPTKRYRTHVSRYYSSGEMAMHVKNGRFLKVLSEVNPFTRGKLAEQEVTRHFSKQLIAKMVQNKHIKIEASRPNVQVPVKSNNEIFVKKLQELYDAHWEQIRKQFDIKLQKISEVEFKEATRAPQKMYETLVKNPENDTFFKMMPENTMSPWKRGEKFKLERETGLLTGNPESEFQYAVGNNRVWLPRPGYMRMLEEGKIRHHRYVFKFQSLMKHYWAKTKDSVYRMAGMKTQDGRQFVSSDRSVGFDEAAKKASEVEKMSFPRYSKQQADKVVQSLKEFAEQLKSRAARASDEAFGNRPKIDKVDDLKRPSEKSSRADDAEYVEAETLDPTMPDDEVVQWGTRIDDIDGGELSVFEMIKKEADYVEGAEKMLMLKENVYMQNAWKNILSLRPASPKELVGYSNLFEWQLAHAPKEVIIHMQGIMVRAPERIRGFWKENGYLELFNAYKTAVQSAKRAGNTAARTKAYERMAHNREAQGGFDDYWEFFKHEYANAPEKLRAKMDDNFYYNLTHFRLPKKTTIGERSVRRDFLEWIAYFKLFKMPKWGKNPNFLSNSDQMRYTKFKNHIDELYELFKDAKFSDHK